MDLVQQYLMIILVIVVIVLGLRLLNYILNPSSSNTTVKDPVRPNWFDNLAKSIDTSSFSDNQKKSTEKLLSDISKEVKNNPNSISFKTKKNYYIVNGKEIRHTALPKTTEEEKKKIIKRLEKFKPDVVDNADEPVESKESKNDQSDNEGILNIIRDSEKDKQSNKEEILDITINDVKYQVSDSETIRKIKKLNDPNNNNISSLFDLKEYYNNGNIKKETFRGVVRISGEVANGNLYFEIFYDENGNKTKSKSYNVAANRLRNQTNFLNEDNYKVIEYYVGGETRQSFFVDGIQEGIEKVYDKNRNLVEEHTFENGKNTYYKRFIDGKVSEESVIKNDRFNLE